MTPEEEKYFRILYHNSKSYCIRKADEPWNFTPETYLAWWDDQPQEMRDARIHAARSIAIVRINSDFPWSPENMEVRPFVPGIGLRRSYKKPMQMSRELPEPTKVRRLSVSEWVAELREARQVVR